MYLVKLLHLHILIWVYQQNQLAKPIDMQCVLPFEGGNHLLMACFASIGTISVRRDSGNCCLGPMSLLMVVSTHLVLEEFVKA